MITSISLADDSGTIWPICGSDNHRLIREMKWDIITDDFEGDREKIGAIIGKLQDDCPLDSRLRLQVIDPQQDFYCDDHWTVKLTYIGEVP